MKDIAQYFIVVEFFTVFMVVQNFRSVYKTLECGHSQENFWVVLLCGTVYYTVQGYFLTFKYMDKTLVSDHSVKAI